MQSLVFDDMVESEVDTLQVSPSTQEGEGPVGSEWARETKGGISTENLRETNVELREENPKTSPENLIITFCGAP